MIPLRKDDELYTYADYLKWPDEERWELIEGIPFEMAAAPRPYHQEILGNLFLELNKNKKKHKQCKIYISPYDVRFPGENQKAEEVSNVVQPDIAVVCDPAKMDERGCNGAPDFIVEITSPSTAIKDLKYKRHLYEKHGVPECWIILPMENTIMVYKLNEKKEYARAEVFGKKDSITLKLKESSVEIKLESVF
ncbi:MAG: Uma2 family endonuclease [bacterium]|nr:Uma2 family endonuclease [bacterium]